MPLRETWRKNWPEVGAASTGGLPEFVLARRPAELGAGVPVFCYHVVEADQFERDLEFLQRNGYVTIGADALLAHMTGESPAPDRSVVLTFDDGAVNLYRVAYPLLRAYGFRAVAFVAPRYHEVASEGERATSQGDRPCTWSELEEMQAAGVVEVQCHTYEHRYVPRWPEPCELQGCGALGVPSRAVGEPLPLAVDLALARAILERRLGQEVRHIAWPQFDGTAEAVEVARTEGYVACWWGVLPRRDLNRPGDDPSRIVRINGDLLRRLPGAGRVRLREVLLRRVRRRIARNR